MKDVKRKNCPGRQRSRKAEHTQTPPREGEAPAEPQHLHLKTPKRLSRSFALPYRNMHAEPHTNPAHKRRNPTA
jgi:hypothetical protein